MRTQPFMATGLAAITLAAAASAALATTAHAATRAGICAHGVVCLWGDNDFRGGCTMRWRPSQGTRAVPHCMKDSVGSFIANAKACFVDSYNGGIREGHRAEPGDYSRAYSWRHKFGNRMDQIRRSC
jgi:hypothetical protein